MPHHWLRKKKPWLVDNNGKVMQVFCMITNTTKFMCASDHKRENLENKEWNSIDD